MKKIIALGLLALIAVGYDAGRASAWWPWFGGCCSNKCTTTISLKQYNAFTPICCGSLYCDGCCPLNLAGCGQGICGPGILGMGGMCGQGCGPQQCAPMCADAGYGATCVDGGDYGLGHLPAPVTAPASPAMAAPVQAPAAPTGSTQLYQQPRQYAPIQTAAYRPAYYYPQQYQARAAAPYPYSVPYTYAPYYWYNGR